MYEYAYVRPSRVTSGAAIVLTPVMSGSASVRTARRGAVELADGHQSSLASQTSPSSLLRITQIQRPSFEIV
jgi:hypothetical protein